MQFKILSYLENFAGSNSPSTCIIFVSLATHEKREIKNTSKFSTRTVRTIEHTEYFAFKTFANEPNQQESWCNYCVSGKDRMSFTSTSKGV